MWQGRKSGYYWVELPGNYGWEIGLYTNIDGLWSFFVTNSQYTDSMLINIDENLITR